MKGVALVFIIVGWYLTGWTQGAAIFNSAPDPLVIQQQNQRVLQESENVRQQNVQRQRNAASACETEVYSSYAAIYHYRNIEDGSNPVYIIMRGTMCGSGIAVVKNGMIISVEIQGSKDKLADPLIIYNQKARLGIVDFIFL